MRKVLLISICLNFGGGICLSQTLPSYSSKLLLPKQLSLNSFRWNEATSQAEFGVQILGVPFGISSFVYNDPPYTGGVDFDIFSITDAAWNRMVLYGKTSSDQRIYFRGYTGTAPVGYQCNSPRSIVGDERNLYVSDTYNNRVHVYEVNLEVPEDTTNFRGFDSLANGLPLRTPLGIDRALLLNQDGSFFAKHIAVADYGNNRVVIFPNGFGSSAGETYPNGNESRYQLYQPTAVAYVWDKTTGRQKNELYVVSQGNGDIYWLGLNSPTGGAPTVDAVIKCDFDQLVRDNLARPNYYLTAAAVDNHGLLWVLDSYNNMVYKFFLHHDNVIQHDTIELIGSWGGYGTGDGQLLRPNALAAQHVAWVDRCGGNPACPNNRYPLANLHDILVTETWRPETGIRRFSIGVEAFVDSFKYVAKSDAGGNFVNWWHHFTDYASLTERVFRGGTLIQTVTDNVEVPPRSNNFGLWDVGTNDSGTYRIEITANSLYGDASDTKSFTVFVDTSKRNGRPSIAQNPYYLHPEWACFFPPDSGVGLGPNNYGGDFVKVAATDPENDPLTYTWVVDTTFGFVGRDSRHVSYQPPGTISSYSTFADSVFYAVPTSYRRGFAPATDCNHVQCLALRVTDPAGNWIQVPGVVSKSPCQKGDLNADGLLSPSDVVQVLNVIFMGEVPAPYGDYVKMVDMNCDGSDSPADAVLFLNKTFLGTNLPC